MKTRFSKTGFTLVEIMIVVMIIGVLVAIALPAFSRARMNSQNVRFINDLRIATGAIESYVMEQGRYPADRNPGVIPVGLSAYLKNLHWEQTTPIGGQWDWDYNVFGAKAGISVYFGNTAQDTRMQDIDRRIDDGNLATGFFRKRSQGYVYVIEW
jgi:prepilin-type N-terminal cleavage/methylation domain-containing protein